MKIRMGFVSNSSSSSFVINKYDLSPRQIDQIRNYQEVAEEMNTEGRELYIDSYWQITETDETIGANTIMDNFDFDEFLTQIGVKEEYVKWSEY